jgi:hypothetical protein
MPSGVTGLLNAIDPQLAYPRNLVKVLLALRSPSTLLRSLSARRALLDLLPPDQAAVLASLLQGNKGNDPYAFLHNFNFAKKSHLKILFNFLGVGIQEEPESAVGPSDTVVDPA